MFDHVFQKIGVHALVLPGQGTRNVVLGKIQIDPAGEYVGAAAHLDEKHPGKKFVQISGLLPLI